MTVQHYLISCLSVSLTTNVMVHNFPQHYTSKGIVTQIPLRQPLKTGLRILCHHTDYVFITIFTENSLYYQIN